MDFLEFLRVTDVHLALLQNQTEVGEQVVPDNQPNAAGKAQHNKSPSVQHRDQSFSFFLQELDIHFVGLGGL